MKRTFFSFVPLMAVLFIFGHCNFKCSYRDIGFVRALFYPPQQDMQGGLPADTPGAVFNHADFDRIVKTYVDTKGHVDYGRLGREGAPALKKYIERLAAVDLDSLGSYERLALYTNAYNAFTLQLMLNHQGVPSIRKIDKAWDRKEWNLGGQVITLNDLEHKWVRVQYDEPRIHFILVCAAISCPWLRNEAYTGRALVRQLTDATNIFYSRPDAGYRREGNTLYLSELMDWYKSDFVSNAGSVVDYIIATHPDASEVAFLKANKDNLKIKFSKYSWDLNGNW